MRLPRAVRASSIGRVRVGSCDVAVGWSLAEFRVSVMLRGRGLEVHGRASPALTAARGLGVGHHHDGLEAAQGFAGSTQGLGIADETGVDLA